MLNTTDELHRSIIQHLDTCIFVHRCVDPVSLRFSLVDLNLRACEWLGCSHQDAQLSATDLGDLFRHPAGEARNAASDPVTIFSSLHLAWEGDAQEFQYSIKDPGKPDEYFEVRFCRMGVGSDLLLTTLRDISNSKRAEERLEAAAVEFRTLADNLPLNVARWSPQGTYLYVNPEHARTLEKSLDEVVGTGIPDSHERVKQTITEVIESGMPSLFVPQKIEDSEGKAQFHEVSVVPEFDQQGQIVSLLGIGRNMTELVTTQELLVVQQQRFKSLLEYAPDNIACYDVFGNILYLSAGLLRVFNMSIENVVGRRLDAVWSNKNAASFQMAVFEVINSGTDLQIEIVLETPDGPRIHEVLLVPEKNVSGAVVGAICFGRDITARKRDEEELGRYRKHLEALVHERTEELERTRDEARNASLAKGAFLANMSHEIRTPMNAILGLTHILMRGQATSEQLTQLGKINAAGKHLLSVINDVLDLSKIEAGKLELESLPVKLPDLVSNVLSIVSGRAADKGIELQAEVPELEGTLLGDQVRLQQALLNYVGNAIKFSKAGTVTLRIQVEDETDQQVSIRFEVTDQGVGIAPENMPRLFCAFEQANRSVTREYGGTGLGLAITRRLAEAMGGNIGVHSVPGQGSTFWFTAILRREFSFTHDSDDEASISAEQLIGARHSGRAVLVVDDDPLNREVAEFLLTRCGLVVESAEDGAASLRKFQDGEFSLVLMDMQMPVMNGLEATEQLRKTPKGKQIPVVAMTANAYEKDKQRCRDAGMDDFLIKPFEPENFFRCVLKWLERPATAKT